MKNIVISGGSDGLGRALAIALSAKGHRVAILSTSGSKLKYVAVASGCLYKVCDVSKWTQVETTIKTIADELGGIDVLINNAGVSNGGKIEDAQPEVIQQTFDVNVVGVLYLTKAVIPYMKKRKGGHIININSQGGLYAKPERSLYGGSKWAITGITKILQVELAPEDIKVTGLYPGAMEQTMATKDGRKPQANSIKYQEMIDAVEFVLSRGPDTVIPELGIKNLDN